MIDDWNESSQSLVMGRCKGHGKAGPNGFKRFHLFEYNKGMVSSEVGQRMNKRRSKDFITAIDEKKSDLYGLSKDTYPILLPFTHCGNKSILRVLRIIPVILPEHPSETIAVHNEDGNPARANFKQALGYLKDGDGNGNSYAQDGDPSQDDVRLCLDDDLKKAQDHSQRQATDQNQVDKTKKFLSSKFSMKDMGEADVILGKPVDQLEYSRAIGCLMYPMTSTRTDIAYDVRLGLEWFTINLVAIFKWASKIHKHAITGSTMASEFVALSATRIRSRNG
ncbi:hypothetical protein Tco_1123243 [Tanacetum coccineum]|uniref:Uncharacterized protein n=1 Tax=Tanacetum coccineum TaxID=301880 RepID=A0ABQ5J5R1_9ASTR